MRRRTILGAALLASLTSSAAAKPAAADNFTVDARPLLKVVQTGIEVVFSDMLHGLRIISATMEAQEGSWAALGPVLKRASDEWPTRPLAWVAQPDGSYAATATNGPAPYNLSDRAYFKELLAGNDVLGTVVTSKLTGQRAAIVATPVMTGARVKAFLGLSVPCRMIVELMNRDPLLPEDLVLTALDDSGQIALHSEPQWTHKAPDMADPKVAAAIRQILQSNEGAIRWPYRGNDRPAVFSRSDTLGWHFILAKNTA